MADPIYNGCCNLLFFLFSSIGHNILWEVLQIIAIFDNTNFEIHRNVSIKLPRHFQVHYQFSSLRSLGASPVYLQAGSSYCSYLCNPGGSTRRDFLVIPIWQRDTLIVKFARSERRSQFANSQTNRALDNSSQIPRPRCGGSTELTIRDTHAHT